MSKECLDGTCFNQQSCQMFLENVQLRSNKFLTMPHSFSIQVAAERTGLTPHVIRAWERRYRAVEPERSSGQQRLYSEVQIERLAMLYQAVQLGHSIGKIASLPPERLRQLVAETPRQPAARSGVTPEDSGAPFRQSALDATMRFDHSSLDMALRHGLLQLGNQGLLRLVIAPLAQEIGQRWRTGDLTAAHEHLFTDSVKVFLGNLTRQIATPLQAPRIIVGTPAGQLHELGAVMAASIAANLGWRAIYLGPNLPAHELAGAVLRNDASAIALSMVYPEDDPLLAQELADLARLLPSGTRIFAGGRAARAYFQVLVRIGALFSESVDEFGEQLDRLRREQPRRGLSG